MRKSLYILSGFILLLCIGSVEPEHNHVDARLYFNNLKFVEVEYCPTKDMILIEGEHKQTKYRIRYGMD